MKILQINSAKAFGGGEKHLIDLIEGLQLRKNEVFVGIRPNNSWEEKLGFLPKNNIIRFPLRNSADIFSAKKLADFVKKKNIEVIHAHVARDYPIAALASRLSKVPLVLTRHLTYKIGAIHRFTFNQAKRIIAVSNGVADSLLANNFASQEKISVIYNGVDIDKLAKIKREKTNSELVVATVGELREHKGQEDFIRAASMVLKEYPEAKFLLIGKDNSKSQEYKVYLENLIKELDLQKEVIFAGWFDTLAEIYSQIDIFVSSARSEPFGLVIAEAMASGKAIAATKTIGAAELLIDNESGKLISIGNIEEMAQAIIELLKNEDLRRDLGKNAQIRAKESFSLAKMVSETEKLYQAVI